MPKKCTETTHHVIPCSLMGLDTPENRMRLEQKKHDHLHETLSVPYKLIRRVRFQTAGALIMTPDDIERWVELQRVYFNNTNLLPIDVANKQIRRLTDQVNTFAWVRGEHTERVKCKKPEKARKRTLELVTEIGEIRKAMAGDLLECIDDRFLIRID